MKNILISTSILTLVFCYLSGFAQIRVETPDLIFPEDEEVEISTDIVFNWSAELNATAYQIQVSVDPDFSSFYIDSTTIYPALDASLNFSTTYYWKVRAIDGDEFSDFSEPFSFSTLEFLYLDKPDEGDYLGEDISEVVFKWEPLLTSQKEIQIDTNNSWKLYHTYHDGGQDLFGLHFFDHNNGWVCGEEGFLLNIVDNQSTVYNESDFESSDLHDLSFHDEDLGYCVGTSGFLAMYNGESWSQVSDPVLEMSGVNNLDFQSINCVDDTAIIFGGESNFVLKSMGETFTIDTIKYDDNGSMVVPDFEITSIEFQSYNNGWVCGSSVVDTVPGIFYSIDGVWNFINSDAHDGGDLTDLAVIGQDDVWFCGEGGLILHYDGDTLIKIEPPFGIDDDLFGIAAQGNEVVVVGEGGLSFTYVIDAAEWRYAILPDENDIYDIMMLDDNTGLTVGESASMFKYVIGNMPFENPTFDFIIPEDSATQYTYKNLLFGSVFSWRIRGFNEVDTSNWSDVWLFATAEFVQLASPGNNEIIADLNPLLEWDEFEGVEIYELEVDDEPTFANAQQFVTADSVFEKQISGLHYGSTVYWRVRAESVLDLSKFAMASFTTADEVALRRPINMIDSLELMPTFEWFEIEGSTAYRLQYSTDSLFSSNNTNILVPVEGGEEFEPKFTLTEDLDEDVQYFWRVKAFSSNDSSAYCEPWSFITQPEVGIDEVSQDDNLRIYPNPAQEQATLFIHADFSSTANYSLMDISGSEVMHGRLNLMMGENNHTIKFDGLKKGVYLLNIYMDETTMPRKLIIK